MEALPLDGVVGSGDPKTQREIPVVDLGGRREEVVEKVKKAVTTVGFFQVVNHGVPESLIDAMLNMSREFHELPEEEKIKYTGQQPPIINYAKTLGDESLCLLTCYISTSEPINPNELPEVCRGEMMKYSEHLKELETLLLEILAEALGLKSDHLLGMDCAKGHVIGLNYYVKSTKPEPTLGLPNHTDRCFLTILAQDQIGGLQVLYQNDWVNLPPVPGALIVNIGDLLKLVSNDAFTSAEHRVWANYTKTRASVSCLLLGDASSSKMYGPIKELLSENSPPLYRETTIQDYIVNSRQCRFDGSSTLAHLEM